MMSMVSMAVSMFILWILGILGISTFAAPFTRRLKAVHPTNNAVFQFVWFAVMSMGAMGAVGAVRVPVCVPVCV